MAVSFQGTHTNSNGTILLRFLNLRRRLIQRQSRNHARPAQPAVALSPHFAEPAVPTAAERHFDFRPFGYLFDPERVMEHLYVDTQPIHMLQSQLHVVQFSCRLRSFQISARLLRQLTQLLLV